MRWQFLLLEALAAIIVTAATTPLTIKLAIRQNAIDYPDGRRVNTEPTPRLGGIAILLGVVSAIGVYIAASMAAYGFVPLQVLSQNINYPLVLAAVSLVFLAGYLDDLFDLPAWAQLIMQALAAVLAVLAGVLIKRLGAPVLPAAWELGALAYPVTIVYLVAFANMINLIDGLDGLAAGVVAISATALLVLSASRGAFDAVVLSLALISACLAFLRFNFHPAKVFMGDCGAQFLGFSLGIVSLLAVVRTSALVSLLIPIVIAGIPVLDTFFSIIRRIRRGSQILKADKMHIHHRLLVMGMNQRTAVLSIYALSALLALFSCLIVQVTGWVRVVVSILLLGLTAFLVLVFGIPEGVLRHYYNQRAARNGKPVDD